MNKIQEALKQAIEANPEEFPAEIDPEAAVMAFYLMIDGVRSMLARTKPGEPVSAIMGIDAPGLEKIRAECRRRVLVGTKGEAIRAMLDIEGWTTAERIYGGYWLGLYEGGLR